MLVATFLFLKISSNFRVWIVNHLRQCAHLKLRTILQLPIRNGIGSKNVLHFFNPSHRRDEEKESVKVRVLRTFSIWRPPRGEMQQQRTGLPIEVLCLAIPVAIPPLPIPIPIPMSHPSSFQQSPIKQSNVTPCCRELICAFFTKEALHPLTHQGSAHPMT